MEIQEILNSCFRPKTISSQSTYKRIGASQYLQPQYNVTIPLPPTTDPSGPTSTGALKPTRGTEIDFRSVETIHISANISNLDSHSACRLYALGSSGMVHDTVRQLPGTYWIAG